MRSLLFASPNRAHFPVCAECLYGEWLREGLEEGQLSTPSCDPEYTLLFAQARKNATFLGGTDILKTFPHLSPEHIRQTMRDAHSALLTGLREDARNILLTLARMWVTASTDEFFTKNAAVACTISQPLVESATFAYARRTYLSEIADEGENLCDEAKQLAKHLCIRLTGLLGLAYRLRASMCLINPNVTADVWFRLHLTGRNLLRPTGRNILQAGFWRHDSQRSCMGIFLG